jgi:RNA polymerase sigma-70 factor (ECF subfamily)
MSGSLVDRMQAADAEAWVQFAAVYGPLVYRWCRVAGIQPADAADIVQEVFTTAAGRMGEFRHSRPGSLRAWLHSISRNKIGDHFRRVRKNVRGEGGSGAARRLADVANPEGPEANPDSTQDIPWLMQQGLAVVRAEFEERTWNAFWCVVAEDRSPVDVAGALGVSVQAVYKAKSRVLARLRQVLGDNEPDLFG